MKIRTRLTLVAGVTIVVFYLIFFFINLTLINHSSEENIYQMKELLNADRTTNLIELVEVAYSTISNHYAEWINTPVSERVSEYQAKEDLKEEVSRMRYANGTGYFWLNDTGFPFPKMVMHPISPSLEGNVMDDPKYNCALGEDVNLFIAFRDVCLSNGSGVVNYLWPKPLENGLSEEQEETSFVKIFEPWDWIIGTGVYISDIEDATKGILVNAQKQLNVQKRNQGIWLLIIALFSVIVTIFLINTTAKRSTSTIQKLNVSIEKMDLKTNIDVETNDEIGILAKNFRKFKDNLARDIVNLKKQSKTLIHYSQDLNQLINSNVNKLMSDLLDHLHTTENITNDQVSGVEQVNAVLEETVRNIDSITNNINHQAASVEESASSIEEMTRSINNVANTVNKTMELSKHLNETAKDGATSVRKSVNSIREVSEYSQQILKMLKLITDIAKQTNLLAMNASIEAAHAGEAGKGFAIVADEIRRLSENTGKNVREIGDVVNSIVEKIEVSVSLSETAGVGLDQILNYSEQNMKMVSQLDITMEEQNNSAQEILRATQKMVSITEEVKISMQEQRTGIEEFATTMRNLRDLSGDNQETIHEHAGVINQLSVAINNMEIISNETDQITRNLSILLEHFDLNESDQDNDPTSMKLVE